MIVRDNILETYSQIDWESFAKDNEIYKIVSDAINERFLKNDNNNSDTFQKFSEYKLFIETNIVN